MSINLNYAQYNYNKIITILNFVHGKSTAIQIVFKKGLLLRTLMLYKPVFYLDVSTKSQSRNDDNDDNDVYQPTESLKDDSDIYQPTGGYA